jgi:hypothetical protein
VIISATTAAIWSALAGTFAAVISIFIFSIHRRNWLLSLKPELVLGDWSRSTRDIGGVLYDQISFKKIKNVGRGIALHVYVLAGGQNGDPPTHTGPMLRYSIIGPGEEFPADGDITLLWPNMKNGGGILLPINVQILSWDTGNYRHETRYSLLAAKAGSGAQTGDNVARDVTLTSRTTRSRPVWAVRQGDRLALLKRRMFRRRQFKPPD